MSSYGSDFWLTTNLREPYCICINILPCGCTVEMIICELVYCVAITLTTNIHLILFELTRNLLKAINVLELKQNTWKHSMPAGCNQRKLVNDNAIIRRSGDSTDCLVNYSDILYISTTHASYSVRDSFCKTLLPVTSVSSQR